LRCCLLGPLLCIVSFRWYMFCLLVVLVKFQYLPSDWLERLRGSLTVARGSSPQSPGRRVLMICFLGLFFSCVTVQLYGCVAPLPCVIYVVLLYSLFVLNVPLNNNKPTNLPAYSSCPGTGQGRSCCGLGSLFLWKYVGWVRVSFWPTPKNVAFSHSKLLSDNSARSRHQDKTNFSGAWKSFMAWPDWPNQDKDLNFVLKESLRTRIMIMIITSPHNLTTDLHFRNWLLV